MLLSNINTFFIELNSFTEEKMNEKPNPPAMLG